MTVAEILSYEFVRNAVFTAVLASLLCGLVGTFVVVKRLVFVSGGVSHAAFGGLGLCHFLGLQPLIGAGIAAVLTALLISRGERRGGRSRDALIGILWAVGMAVGVVFIALTPGYAPDLTTYLFGDILAISRPLLLATAVLSAAVLICVGLLFKELVAVSFDEEFARAQGLPVKRLLGLLMILIALSIVLLIQAVGAILSIALLTIPPTIALETSRSFRGVMLQAAAVGLVMTFGGLGLSFLVNLPSGPTIVLVGFLMLTGMSGWRAVRARLAPRMIPVALLLLAAQPLVAQPPGGRDVSSRASAPITSIRHLEWLGEAIVPAASTADLPRLGGLSGLTWDADRRRFYAVSDDRAEHGPARFYSLQIDLQEGRLDSDGVRLLGWTELVLADGQPFGRSAVDPEGIALTPDRTLVVSSEGNAPRGVPPFLREFSLDGRQLTEFPLDRRYFPRADGQAGVRENLALESAAVSPDGRWLFTAAENALAQDGPPATSDAASPSRILKYTLAERTLEAEFLYWVDPVAKPSLSGGYSTAGLVELMVLDEDTLLGLERSFSLGVGNEIRIYEIDLRQADDISSIDRLDQHGTERIRAAGKRLLLHVNRLGIRPDNLEGMTLGPPLADGTRTLFLLADDNFNPTNQTQQILAFALREKSASIEEIQGAGHRSPFERDWLRGVEGTVTAVDADPDRGGFWLQERLDGDEDDIRRSNGLFVVAPSSSVDVGDSVRVDGAVIESGRRGALTVTRLDAAIVETVASAQPLPPAVAIGSNGRRPPAQIVDDDQLTRFDPCCDAIDFYESLEGMRVQVDRAVAASGRSRFGEIAVLPDGGEGTALRTPRGGVVLRSGDDNPERLIVADRLAPGAPATAVGDVFRRPLSGVLDYSFGNFKLLVEDWPATLRPQRFPPAGSAARRYRDAISVATYNVLNLDPQDGPERFRRLAEGIVGAAGSPDLLGLQEVQDDNGPEDGGVVSAERTLRLLIEAILAAGGPRYDYRQIDPVHNADGGEPNGNIRVVWMFRPERVQWIDRRSAGDEEVGVRTGIKGQVELTASPGLLGVADPAFDGDPGRSWEAGRKCLVGEAIGRGEHLFLINCHLKSKRGDDRLFGVTQPPQRHTEEQRSMQARRVIGFVREILQADPGARIIVLGDMNDHDFRPPVRVLSGDLLVNLTERVPQPDRYSFNFNGNSQLLDHILVSPALARRVGGVDILHLNADYSAGHRASDHDPVIAWFQDDSDEPATDR